MNSDIAMEQVQAFFGIFISTGFGVGFSYGIGVFVAVSVVIGIDKKISTMVLILAIVDFLIIDINIYNYY